MYVSLVRLYSPSPETQLEISEFLSKKPIIKGLFDKIVLAAKTIQRLKAYKLLEVGFPSISQDVQNITSIIKIPTIDVKTLLNLKDILDYRKILLIYKSMPTVNEVGLEEQRGLSPQICKKFQQWIETSTPSAIACLGGRFHELALSFLAAESSAKTLSSWEALGNQIVSTARLVNILYEKVINEGGEEGQQIARLFLPPKNEQNELILEEIEIQRMNAHLDLLAEHYHWEKQNEALRNLFIETLRENPFYQLSVSETMVEPEAPNETMSQETSIENDRPLESSSSEVEKDNLPKSEWMESKEDQDKDAKAPLEPESTPINEKEEFSSERLNPSTSFLAPPLSPEDLVDPLTSSSWTGPSSDGVSSSDSNSLIASPFGLDNLTSECSTSIFSSPGSSSDETDSQDSTSLLSSPFCSDDLTDSPGPSSGESLGSVDGEEVHDELLFSEAEKRDDICLNLIKGFRTVLLDKRVSRWQSLQVNDVAKVRTFPGYADTPELKRKRDIVRHSLPFYLFLAPGFKTTDYGDVQGKKVTFKAKLKLPGVAPIHGFGQVSTSEAGVVYHNYFYTNKNQNIVDQALEQMSKFIPKDTFYEKTAVQHLYKDFRISSTKRGIQIENTQSGIELFVYKKKVA